MDPAPAQPGADAFSVPVRLLTAVVVLLLTAWRRWAARQRDERKLAEVHAAAAVPATADGAEDPLCWSFLPSTGIIPANAPRAEETDTDLATVKVLAMHRPTHEPWRDAEGDYPYSWHLLGRRRLWEIRIQIRFKQRPEGCLYLGLELAKYVPVSRFLRRVQATILRACRTVVGCSFYHSVGDDPAETAGECEPPTVAMPMWAIDQFVVSDIGEEPELTGDLSAHGLRRSDGLARYAAAMRRALEDISSDRVYTFCLWGVSQFADCVNWRVWGGLPGLWLDIDQLCGAPPLYVALYDLAGARPEGEDQRHLVSRKRYYVHTAMWSRLHPPSRDAFASSLPQLGGTDLASGAAVDCRPVAGRRPQRFLAALADLLAVTSRCCGSSEGAARASGSARRPALAPGTGPS